MQAKDSGKKDGKKMSELTPAEEEAYVKACWINPALPCMRGAEFKVLPTMTKRSMIHEAYLFTVQREEEIADIQAEIAWLEWSSIKNNSIGNIRERILSREQAALAELRRGWKGIVTYGKPWRWVCELGEVEE
jgi:hypothetical protein